ncbi:MAG: UDP-N-acetylglucosamine 2-epimerase (non-hydrolyzing) [Flavobacteriales bacterium]|nr:UDP-N-acetylglucosamine 2-epimerase (non-hydrolyzing) [Flavobacteriales bacterium]
MKILTVLGARPQFIKAAAVSRVLRKTHKVKETIVHTGQHFDQKMSDIFFEEMSIPEPDFNLEINSLGHGAMTGRMMEGIEDILKKESFDLLMVYGDTNSTIAGALAASKLHVPVAHIEAGLRSFNMKMPEEINRILTDRISSLLFCPTATAVQNLRNEGFEHYDCSIIKNGDVMQDAALFYSEMSSSKSTIIQDSQLQDEDFVLVTLHRQENTDDIDKLTSVVSALNQLSKKYRIVFPIHPRTSKRLIENGLNLTFETIEPVGYFDIVELLKQAKLVLTDSGGLQKEAFFFETPCLVMREQTEWVELIEHGYAKLVGAKKELIVDAVDEMAGSNLDYSQNLYGQGKASEIILDSILSLSN